MFVPFDQSIEHFLSYEDTTTLNEHRDKVISYLSVGFQSMEKKLFVSSLGHTRRFPFSAFVEDEDEFFDRWYMQALFQGGNGIF